MALIDEIKLHIEAGAGGDGVVRWRRERSKPLGGPGGGNGGRGGDVFVIGISDIGYLETYSNVKELSAGKGEAGRNFGENGASGKDLLIKLPIGSLVKNLATGEVFDIQSTTEQVLILKGGNGGRGNESFKSSRNVSPKESTPGEPGEHAEFVIELQMIADAGFIGLPSAGKSSLLNSITSAKSKVAAYHFTTLDPHLGALYEFVLADIPGLIEGASAGKGLGIKFLRHIVRTKALIHVLSLESTDILSDYKTIRNELGQYNKELLEKPEVIVFSKTDTVTEIDSIKKSLAKVKEFKEKDQFFVSVYDEESVKNFKDGLVKILRGQK